MLDCSYLCGVGVIADYGVVSNGKGVAMALTRVNPPEANGNAVKLRSDEQMGTGVVVGALTVVLGEEKEYWCGQTGASNSIQGDGINHNFHLSRRRPTFCFPTL